jgi:ankyrin repeat protein
VDEAATPEIQKIFEEFADNVWVRTNDGDLEFLEKYANPEKLRYFINSRGESLLMIAARHGHVDLMKFFLKNNANIDARSFHLQTPLHFAVQYKHTKAIELLLEYGANQDSIDVNGCSAFNLAQKNGSKEVILPFLEHSQRDPYDEAKKGNFKW